MYQIHAQTDIQPYHDEFSEEDDIRFIAISHPRKKSISSKQTPYIFFYSWRRQLDVEDKNHIEE